MYWGSRKAFYSIKFYFELGFDLVLHVLRCCSRSTMDSRIQESMFWVKAIRKVWNDQKSKSISNPAFCESAGATVSQSAGEKNSSTQFLEFSNINDFHWNIKKSMISFRTRDEPSYTVSSHLINVWFLTSKSRILTAPLLIENKNETEIRLNGNRIIAQLKNILSHTLAELNFGILILRRRI